jgi:quercetin dioxygenase-like cupin family protein
VLRGKNIIRQEGRFAKTEIREKLFRDFRICGAVIYQPCNDRKENNMKRTAYITLGVLAVSLVLVFGARMAMAQDLAKVSPDAKVLFENDRVRVLEVQHQSGGKEPMHTHPAYVAYSLTNSTTKTTFPDGKTVVKDRKAGDVTWSEPVTHSVENVGTTEFHMLLIELKK